MLALYSLSTSLLTHLAGMSFTVVAPQPHLHATSEAGDQSRGTLGKSSASRHSARGFCSTGRWYAEVPKVPFSVFYAIVVCRASLSVGHLTPIVVCIYLKSWMKPKLTSFPFRCWLNLLTFCVTSWGVLQLGGPSVPGTTCALLAGVWAFAGGHGPGKKLHGEQQG